MATRIAKHKVKRITRKIQNKVLTQNKFSKVNLLVFVFIFASIGGYFIFRSFAATDPLSACPNKAIGHCIPYNPTGPWNTPIGENPKIHPDSNTYINAIADNNLPLTSDNDQYAIPIYLFDNLTPRSSVQMRNYFSYYDSGDDSRVGAGFAAIITGVPIPANAVESKGSDGQIVFWDPVAGVEWGFWQFSKDAQGNYHATNGYRYHTTAEYNGRFADGLAGRGAGTPYFSGLVRKWEVDQGNIEHALSFAYAWPERGFVYPASKSDGNGVAGVDPPEGSRLQLNPDLNEADFDRWSLSPAAKTIARALQKYGMYIIDNSGSSKIYLEDRTTAGWDASVNRNTVSAIPWSEFRVLAPTESVTPVPPPPPPGDESAPTIPTNLTATSGNSQVNLTWTASTDDIGVTGYDVRYRIAGGVEWTVVDVGNITSSIITGLQNGSGYNFQVRARDGAGRTSLYSSIAQATPTSSSSNTPPPSPPPTTKLGDLNSDNFVNIFDLSMLLSNYGTTSTTADVNKDGTVNIFDLSILLSNYGK